MGTTAVGEALRILAREGLVLQGPGGVTRVAPHDSSLLLDACDLRREIDGLSARLAARRGEPLEGALEEALDEQRTAIETEDPRRFVRADIEFHAALLNSSGNSLLPSHVALVRRTCRSVRVEPGSMRQALAEHEAIFAAVCRSDPEEAERAAKAHVRTRGQAGSDGGAALAGTAASRGWPGP